MYSNEADELKQQIEQLQEEVKKWKAVSEDMYDWLQFYKGSSYTEWHNDADKTLKWYEELVKATGI